MTGSHTFEVRVRDFARNEHVESWAANFAAPATTVDPDQLCRDAFAGFPDGYQEFCLHADNPGARTAQYAGLNGEERRLCARLGAAICFQYFNDSRNALWNTKHPFTPTSGTDNSKANAFQHAFWVAQMINSAGSDADAEAFAVAHEGRRHTPEKR